MICVNEGSFFLIVSKLKLGLCMEASAVKIRKLFKILDSMRIRKVLFILN